MQANAKKQNVRMGDLNLRGRPMLILFLGNYHLFLINSVLTPNHIPVNQLDIEMMKI